VQDTATDARPFEELSPTERGHRNMRVLAARLGWPEGLAERLIEIDEEFPAWHTSYYHQRGYDGTPAGSCVAALLEPRRDYAPRLVADSPDELAGMLAEAEEARAEKVNRCPTCGQKRG
jgi:hypothetical protein